MARSEAGEDLTAQHRQAQATVAALALRDFMALWPLWEGDNESFGRLAAATLVLIRAHHRVSTQLAAAYFQSFRRAEGVGGFASPRLADPVNAERVTASLNFTARETTRRALLAGKPPQTARATALVRTSSAVTRHVLQGGRDTVVLSTGEDSQAEAWARVTRGTPCAFCVMLASRGAVYLGHDTAEFEAHDACTCVAEPHYEGSALPPDSVRWRDLYNQAQRDARASGDLARGTSNDALNALRRALAAPVTRGAADE